MIDTRGSQDIGMASVENKLAIVALWMACRRGRLVSGAAAQHKTEAVIASSVCSTCEYIGGYTYVLCSKRASGATQSYPHYTVSTSNMLKYPQIRLEYPKTWRLCSGAHQSFEVSRVNCLIWDEHQTNRLFRVKRWLVAGCAAERYSCVVFLGEALRLHLQRTAERLRKRTRKG